MRRREYRDYLQDIIDSINDIKDFTKNMSFEDFARDKKTINVLEDGRESVRVDLKAFFECLNFETRVC